jgi:hypothetical protein
MFTIDLMGSSIDNALPTSAFAAGGRFGETSP